MAPKNQPVEEVVEEVEVVEEEVVQGDTPKEQIKSIFLSRIFWANTLAFLAFAVQKRYGFVIDEELQMQILTIINIALRTISKDAVTWRISRGNTEEVS